MKTNAERILRVMLCLAVACLGLGPLSAQEPNLSAKKLNALEGTWDLVSLAIDGKVHFPGKAGIKQMRVRLTKHDGINGGDFTLLAPHPDPPPATPSYTIDPSTTPKRIDLTAQLTSLGIFEVI